MAELTYEQAERLAILAADGLATERELRALDEHAERYRPGKAPERPVQLVLVPDWYREA